MHRTYQPLRLNNRENYVTISYLRSDYQVWIKTFYGEYNEYGSSSAPDLNVKILIDELESKSFESNGYYF